MENGFNDDELADIMNEIESLEQEFTEQSAVNDEMDQEYVVESHQDSIESVDKLNEDVYAKKQTNFSETKAEVDNAMDDVLVDLSQMPIEKSVPNHGKVHSFKNPHAKEEKDSSSSMQFHVVGNMTIDLAFTVSGQQVQIFVNEEEGLVISLESGVKFIVPLSESHSARRAS